jgi:hypothetical protein
MTAKDFVRSTLRKNESFGIEGYHLAKTLTNFDGPLVTRIHAGKKKTYIDDYVKEKRHVPDSKYNITTDWAAGPKKANFNKDMRHTLATDIERLAKKVMRPEPSTYKPSHRLTEPSVLGAFNMKGNRDDTSFLAQLMFKGATSPRFHDKKHDLTEKRISSQKFNKPINEKLDA